jgi:hypothetical protein
MMRAIRIAAKLQRNVRFTDSRDWAQSEQSQMGITLSRENAELNGRPGPLRLSNCASDGETTLPQLLHCMRRL